MGLNRKLFAHTGEHRLTYLRRLAALGFLGLAGAGWIVEHTQHDPYRVQFAAAFGVSAILASIAFFLFDMRAIVRKLFGRVMQRMRCAKA
jgi:hypothetical protein